MVHTLSMSACTATTQRKLRIVCLHGYLQNAKEFAGKVGSLRKGLKSRADFIFMDAPHVVDAQQSMTGTAIPDARAWWTWQDPEVVGRPSLASSYTGVQESLQTAAKAVAENEPVDGILGFSQGAALASLFLAQYCQQSGRHGVKFAILAGAFLPRDPQFAQLLTSRAVSIPTLFISGSKDQLIPTEKTDQIAATFDQNIVERYAHSGGHMIPTCTGEFKQLLQSFLDRQNTLER